MENMSVIELEKAVNKAKFALMQKAGELHDLIEDRLPGDYKDIPAYAEAAYRAGVVWDELNSRLKQEKAKV